MRARRAIFALLAAVCLAPAALVAQERGANALGDAIAGLGVNVRVLVIAAHPDDEDTRLITWLQKGHRAEVAYLSLTRGDGGQNLIGNELGDALGVIRTEELLAARRVDGAHQYFTRAYDFGFSKSAAETYMHWPHDSLLKDVITVVRAFRPQVIVTVFTGTPLDGHGHHQVSAILGREAYDLAGDSVRFPAKSTQGLAPWTVSKFYRGRSYFGPPYSYSYNAGEYDPLLGMSYAEIAALSRSNHKSQGFGSLQRKGAQLGFLQREATRVNAGTPAESEKGIFDGIDTAWASKKKLVSPHTAGDSIASRLIETRKSYDPWNPERSVAANLTWFGLLPFVGIPMNAVCDTGSTCVTWPSLELLSKRAMAAQLLAHGVSMDATVARDILAVGDTIPVIVTLYNRGRAADTLIRGTLSAYGYAVAGIRTRALADSQRIVILPDSAYRDTIRLVGRAVTQPWWLVRPRTGDMFATHVSMDAEDAREPVAIVMGMLLVDGFGAPVTAPIIYRYADKVKGEIDRPLAVAPAVTLTLDTQNEYVPANGAIDRPVHVWLRSASTVARQVKVTINPPKGITLDSMSRTVTLPALGAAAVSFRMHGSLPAGAHTLSAVAESNGQKFTTGYQSIEYDHIRPQTMYRDATVTLEAVDVAIPPGANIAYIQGVGDNSAPALQQLGVPVTIIDPANLASADLSPYTAVVIGTRAYDAHPELVANNAKLLDWVKRGGTMVVQYGQYEMLQPGIMPYPITLARPAARVTEENSAVTVLLPNNPVLKYPNAITANDFTGWLQDRALYMPTTFDSAYAAPLSMHDTGESPNQGALLVAPYGKGTYVYVTLAMFRQLPAGVPGAARIMVNLLGARQADAPKVSP